MLQQRLQDCFATIEDPRSTRTQLHQLSDILMIAILSTIAGGQGWEDMEVYGKSKQAQSITCKFHCESQSYNYCYVR